MSPDRVIYSFVLGWVVLLAVLIALDWMGNPNRGAFRPKGDRAPRDRKTRRTERHRRRMEGDASVRAALRDAYGASSLRLTWSGDNESTVRDLDDALVVDERNDAVDVASREIVTIDRTIIMGDTLPNLAEKPPPAAIDESAHDETSPDDTATDDTASEPAAPRRRGWKTGDDPLALTAKGTEPAATTIRSRVWKNHAISGAWSDENRSLLAAGKAPRRVNPLTGRHERAVVDIETGRASWGSEPVDPFEVEE